MLLAFSPFVRLWLKKKITDEGQTTNVTENTAVTTWKEKGSQQEAGDRSLAVEVRSVGVLIFHAKSQDAK